MIQESHNENMHGLVDAAIDPLYGASINLCMVSLHGGIREANQRPWLQVRRPNRKVDIRLHGKENSNSHGSRPVYPNHLDDMVDSDQ